MLFTAVQEYSADWRRTLLYRQAHSSEYRKASQYPCDYKDGRFYF